MTIRRGTTSDNGFIHIPKNKWKLIYNKKKILGRIWRAALTGHGQSSQSANFWKIAKMALFNACMRLKNFLGQMTLFDVAKNSSLWNLFIKSLWPCPFGLRKLLDFVIVFLFKCWKNCNWWSDYVLIKIWPFWQFLRNWLIGWIGHALLVQSSISAHRKWPEMVVSASTNQVWTKITIRSYAWSFGYSDPDPSNVGK